MSKIVLEVKKDDLVSNQKHQDVVGDYPLYGSTDGLGRTDMALISKILGYDFGNETLLKVTIEVVGKVKINYKA